MNIVWLACQCHVWPCSPIAPIGRCGKCKQRPERVVDEPADGKAHEL